MIDGLSGRQVDSRAYVPDGWEGRCVCCKRRLKWWHVRKEMVALLVDGDFRAACCREHIDRGNPAQVAAIGRLLSAELERLKGGRVIGQLRAARSVTLAQQKGT